jgi:H/ACA ribonucleoprotein complex subunit 1
MGIFVHSCESELVFKSVHTKIPKFNAPVFLENKQQVGVLDEIFGPVNVVVCSLQKCHISTVPHLTLADIWLGSILQ